MLVQTSDTAGIHNVAYFVMYTVRTPGWARNHRGSCACGARDRSWAIDAIQTSESVLRVSMSRVLPDQPVLNSHGNQPREMRIAGRRGPFSIEAEAPAPPDRSLTTPRWP